MNCVSANVKPSQSNMLVRNFKMFEEVENAGSEISYRCNNCRNCKASEEHARVDMMSVKKEVEQDVINKSVTVDTDRRIASALLPLIYNSFHKLAPNKDKALHIYDQQVDKLNQNPQDNKDVIQSEAKLQSLRYVGFVRNLTPEQPEMLTKNPVQNFVPWSSVWNGNSISTPCRLVFDASQPTASGTSLNVFLAKGKNNMNKLVEIIIHWSTHKTGFHTDVKKMDNTVQLREERWCFRRYIWQNDLDNRKIPDEKVIKTLIYRVKSSGNQSESGLRETAVNHIVQEDIYVDDCLSGAQNLKHAMIRADQIDLVLNRGGFSLKGVTFSGKDPPATFTNDRANITVAGMRWFPEEDLVSHNISELNFAKKCRGKKPS